MVLALGICIFINILAAGKAYEHEHYRWSALLMFFAGFTVCAFINELAKTL